MSGKTNKDRRVAVVTGGAGAIGGAIAERLAPDHTVIVLDRTGDFAVDLGDPDDVRRAANLVLESHGRCDVFVHAAATFRSEPLEQVELDAWRHVQAVNVDSALLLTQDESPIPGSYAAGRSRADRSRRTAGRTTS
jgi:NAD(P)-dependent dehydrogenase (short-subunit alcohol dehydrogenase family)